MRWKDLRRSSNVRDARGGGGGGGGGGRMGFRLPLGRGRRAGGGLGAIVLLVIVFLIGGPDGGIYPRR